MDDVKSVSASAVTPKVKKLSKNQSHPSHAEIVQRVQENHARTRGAVRNKQNKPFYTDHGS